MVILNIEVLTCEHSRLKRDSHRFAIYQAVCIVKRVGYRCINEIIEVGVLINAHDLRYRAATLRIYGGAIKAIFCKACACAVKPVNTEAFVVCDVCMSVSGIKAVLVFKMLSVIGNNSILGEVQFRRAVFTEIYVIRSTLCV